MKLTLKVFLIVIVPAKICLAADKEQHGIVLPKGLENVYLGMPMSELLKVRPRLESGTDLLSPPDEQGMFGALLNDPNNPRKVDINAIGAIEANWPDSSYKWPHYSYSFKEKAEIPLLETIRYGFSRPWLLTIEMEGFVDTRKEIKIYSQNRNKLLGYLIQIWGKPDKVYIGKHPRDNYYVTKSEWDKGNMFMQIKCPVDVGGFFETATLVDKLWWKILGYGPPVALVITNDRQTKEWQQKPHFLQDFEPVGYEETERLLKSINYYGILEQALKIHNSNQAVLTGGKRALVK